MRTEGTGSDGGACCSIAHKRSPEQFQKLSIIEEGKAIRGQRKRSIRTYLASAPRAGQCSVQEAENPTRRIKFKAGAKSWRLVRCLPSKVEHHTAHSAALEYFDTNNGTMATIIDRRRINAPSGGTTPPVFARTVKEQGYIKSQRPSRTRGPNDLRNICKSHTCSLRNTLVPNPSQLWSYFSSYFYLIHRFKYPLPYQ